MVCAATEKCLCLTALPHVLLFPGSMWVLMQIGMAKPSRSPGPHSFSAAPRPLANRQCLGEARDHPATWGPADNLQVGLLQPLEKKMTLTLPLIPH